MRLDHLLSKEHLALSGVQGPLLGRTSRGGRSWVEHRPVAFVAGVAPVLPFGVWNVRGGGWTSGTLLGPEGTGASLYLGPGPLGGSGASGHVDRRNRSLVRVGTGCAWHRPYLENCTVDASIFKVCLCGQVFKCTRWMPWHEEPKKDVVACDKPRGVGKRTVIRGCPNGETRLESCPVTRA